MHHDELAASVGDAEQEKPMFVDGVIRIVEDPCEWIGEHGAASSKDTPCLRRFDRALASPHSNVNGPARKKTVVKRHPLRLSRELRRLGGRTLTSPSQLPVHVGHRALHGSVHL